MEGREGGVRSDDGDGCVDNNHDWRWWGAPVVEEERG